MPETPTIQLTIKPKLSFLGKIENYHLTKMTPYLLNHRTEVLAMGLILALHMLTFPSLLVILWLGVFLLVIGTTEVPSPEKIPRTLDDYWDLDDEEEVMVP